jgi:site-specific recombinase XerD
MAGTRDPAMRKSDWNTWAAGSRGVEVERLEQELAESRVSERRARLEAAETRERFERLLDASRRFTRTLSDRRRQQQTSRQFLAAQHAIDGAIAGRADGPLLRNEWGNRMRPHNAAAIIRRLARSAGISHRVTPHALRRSYITIGLLQGVPLREMQRAARHAKADTTVRYDQSERSFHRDPTFVLMTATAR